MVNVDCACNARYGVQLAHIVFEVGHLMDEVAVALEVHLRQQPGLGSSARYSSDRKLTTISNTAASAASGVQTNFLHTWHARHPSWVRQHAAEQMQLPPIQTWMAAMH